MNREVLNSPLTGSERVKIITFIMMMLALIPAIGVSVPIIVLLLIGLYIMKKDKNFKIIEKIKKIINFYLLILSFSFAYFLIMLILHYSKKIDSLFIIYIIGVFLIVPLAYYVVLVLFNYLFFSPLSRHKDWVVEHGIFSDYKNNESDVKIIDSDNLRTYSVADELIKWNSLLEKGLITNEEFQKAKTKLLNKE